ncbi:MAG: AAA family ATPase, partial [Methylocystis sp.]
IVGDIDKGNHPANKIDEQLVQIFCESASLIYSTSSASPENRKWRFILPLELSLGFKDRHSLMDALYAFMEANGVSMDWALLRPGQLCYLPNVSPDRREDGLSTGKPIFYENYRRDGEGVTPTSGKAPEWIEKRRLEQEAANALKESMRSATRAASRISKPSSIEQFNRVNPLADILTACDYTQSPYRDDDWQSPHQKSGSYATRIYQEENGEEYWISLSGSDAEAGIGAKSASGVQYGDSFDINVHFKFNGDFKAALQSIPPPQPDANRYRLISANDLAFLPPIKWRVKGILPAEGLVAIYGQPGCGKSFMVFDLLACVGRGIAWFGHKTTKCPVTFVALEGEAGVSQRIRAYQNYHGQLPITVRFMTQQFNFLTPQDVADLAAAIRACGGDSGIICVDTLNRASSGSDENDSKDMGRIIEAAKNLQELMGGLIILIHHSGKNSDRGLRGHSSLLAALDTAIEVVKNDKQRSWKLTKSKDSRDDLAGAFHLE